MYYRFLLIKDTNDCTNKHVSVSQHNISIGFPGRPKNIINGTNSSVIETIHRYFVNMLSLK